MTEASTESLATSLLPAIREAASLCEQVAADFRQDDAHDKADASPVTVADYGSQAVIHHALARLTPETGMVAEEQGDALRASPGLAERVAAFTGDLHPELTAEALPDALDWGACAGGPDRRFWTLDPIDGTKGYLRGDQYAIALALIENGRPVLGFMACPRLPHPDGSTGCLFVGGTLVAPRCYPLSNADHAPIPVHAHDHPDRTTAKLCESVESKHTAHNRSGMVRDLLGISTEVVRLDSQAKYAVVARGEAALYLRLPVKQGYQEKIWDHAAGVAVIEAAGGRVTDLDGLDLDFSRGSSLCNNRGVLATNGALHPAALEAIAATYVTHPLPGS